MKKKTNLLLILLLSLSLETGCANIKDDSTRTKTEGAGTGAAVGAALGALIGQLAGGDTQSTLLGAAIGAAVGGAGGYAYGSHVASEKAKYASREDWINASIAEARQRNSELIAYNRQLEHEVAQLEQEAQKLRSRYNRGLAGKDLLQEKKKKVDRLLDEANQRLAAAREELKAQNSVLDDVDSNDGSSLEQSLAEEITNIKASIQELEKRPEELASLSASMAV